MLVPLTAFNTRHIHACCRQDEMKRSAIEVEQGIPSAIIAQCSQIRSLSAFSVTALTFQKHGSLLKETKRKRKAKRAQQNVVRAEFCQPIIGGRRAIARAA